MKKVFLILVICNVIRTFSYLEGYFPPETDGVKPISFHFIFRKRFIYHNNHRILITKVHAFITSGFFLDFA